VENRNAMLDDIFLIKKGNRITWMKISSQFWIRVLGRVICQRGAQKAQASKNLQGASVLIKLRNDKNEKPGMH